MPSWQSVRAGSLGKHLSGGMNLLKLLRKFKGKRLDGARYEQLRLAAAAQAEKLALVQAANRILVENSDLLRDKVLRLEEAISRRSPHLTPFPATGDPVNRGHIQEISDLTVAILQECLQRGLVEFSLSEMAAFLAGEIGAVGTAVAELVESGLVDQVNTAAGEPTCRLTAAGRSYARTLPAGNSA